MAGIDVKETIARAALAIAKLTGNDRQACDILCATACRWAGYATGDMGAAEVKERIAAEWRMLNY